MKGITLPTLQIAAVAFLVMTCQAAAIGKTNSQVDESNLGPRNPDIGSTIDGAISVQENAVLARSDDVLEKRKNKDPQPQGGSGNTDSHNKDTSVNLSPKLSVGRVGTSVEKSAGKSVAKKVGETVGEDVLKAGLAAFLV
jgi:hypothetical protein